MLPPATAETVASSATGAWFAPVKVYVVRPTVIDSITPSPLTPEPSDQPACVTVASGPSAARHSASVPLQAEP